MKYRRPVAGIILAVLCAFGASTSWADDVQEEIRQWRRKRPPVSRIDIEGNTSISDRDIRRVMGMRTPGFMHKLGLHQDPLLLTGAEERDEASIRRAYRQKGFWDATVSISAAPAPDDQRARVTVFITENALQRWGAVEVAGDDSVLTARARELARELKPGDPADSLAMEYTWARIRSLCNDQGRPRVTVATVVSRNFDTITVSCRMRVGPEVRLGDLVIVGAKSTEESHIRREMGWRPGELYSQRRLAWKQQDVYATGLFTFVHLDPIAPDSGEVLDSSRADFEMRVVERKPSFIGFRTGAGQDPNRDLTWDYAFEWGSRNWRGTGRQWSLTARSGFVIVTDWEVLHHRFAGRYTEPWPFGIRLPTTLTLAYEPGVHSPVQEYRIERVEAGLDVTRRIRRTMRVWSSLVYERVNIYDIPPDREQDYIDEKGISNRRRFRVALERDTRPNLFVPKSGARTRLDMEYVGGILGGAEDFYKIDGSWSRYQTISAPTIFASRVRLAWIHTHSNSESVPTVDRFYLGGANSIRGYAENSVGPKDSTDAAEGGQVVMLANLELRTPLISKFWFTMFLDAGNNFARFRDVIIGDMLVSLGAGLQYMAPVGPLRLDYARRVVHPKYVASDRVHLSILFSF
jgi:outer membrane protein insertion porin family